MKIKKDMTIKGTRKAATCDKNKKNHENDAAETVQNEDMEAWTAKAGNSSNSKISPQTQEEEMLGKTKFIVLQKNERSLNSSERLQELFGEIHQVTWDAILLSETWRQGKRDLGNTARTHHGGIRKIPQQARCRDSVEQEMEKSD